jgi:hypothetical protein
MISVCKQRAIYSKGMLLPKFVPLTNKHKGKRRSPRYPFYRRMGDTRAGLADMEKWKFFYPTGTRIPAPSGRPARSQSLYRLMFCICNTWIWRPVNFPLSFHPPMNDYEGNRGMQGTQFENVYTRLYIYIYIYISIDFQVLFKYSTMC